MDFADYLAKVILGIFGDKASPEEVVQTTLRIFLYGSILFLTAFWRSFFLRVGVLRRLIKPEERFGGQYLQIFESGDNSRYSVLEIAYQPAMGRFFLRGYQYDKDGNPTAAFDSENVTFPESVSEFIEFNWRAATYEYKEMSYGYTQMVFRDPLQGSGFVISFQEPKRYNLKFIKLSNKKLREFGIRRRSRNEVGRELLVRTIHERLNSRVSDSRAR